MNRDLAHCDRAASNFDLVDAKRRAAVAQSGAGNKFA